MKRTLLLCLMGMVISVAVVAKDTTAAQQERYSLRLYGEYNYNTTWSHYGDIALVAHLPINQHFKMKVGGEMSTANVYSASVSMQPKFALPTGEMFISTDLWYRAVMRSRMHDFSAAVSVGYRMDYVSVQLGWLTRSMDDMDRNWHSTDKIMTEPFNLLYELKVWVRPQSSKWNLSLAMTNFDDFQTERMWQPMFTLGAWYNPNDKVQVLADIELKETGMFHLDASFYGISARLGIGYKF